VKTFNKLYTKLLEDMGAAMGNTTSAAFGAGQAHASPTGKSGDFYAPGDSRNLFGGGKGWKPKKGKKKKMNGEAVPLIRRTFPGM